MAASDEEDCYTPRGRRRGVFLTEQTLAGADVESYEVDGALLTDFEVTGDTDEFRSFVVPGKVVKEMTFS